MEENIQFSFIILMQNKAEWGSGYFPNTLQKQESTNMTLNKSYENLIFIFSAGPTGYNTYQRRYTHIWKVFKN